MTGTSVPPAPSQCTARWPGDWLRTALGDSSQGLAVLPPENSTCSRGQCWVGMKRAPETDTDDLRAATDPIEAGQGMA